MFFRRCCWRKLLFPDFVWQSCCNPCCVEESGSVLGISTNIITTTCRNASCCDACGQVLPCGCGCGCCG